MIHENNLFQANLTHLSRNTFVPGIGMGIAKCPYDPADNSTAVWVERGNPGDLPGLYSGTNAEFTKADTVIFRTDLHNLTTGRKEFSFKRTLKYDSKWLDSECLFSSCFYLLGVSRYDFTLDPFVGVTVHGFTLHFTRFPFMNTNTL